MAIEKIITKFGEMAGELVEGVLDLDMIKEIMKQKCADIDYLIIGSAAILGSAYISYKNIKKLKDKFKKNIKEAQNTSYE